MNFPKYHQASQIAFGDTDASGWMHFPNIFKHVEAAEHAFLRSRGIIIHDRQEGGWPRVKVCCEYKSPLQFGDEFEIILTIQSVGKSSVTWEFEVKKVSGELAAFGSMTTVRVNPHGRLIVIPDEERAALVH